MRKIYTLLLGGLFSLSALSQSIDEYCLENGIVHRYMEEVTYDPNDYNYTAVIDYNNAVKNSYRKDRPNPVCIRLENALDTVSTLYVSEKTDFTGAYKITISKGVDSCLVYNLIPGRIYYYKVEYKDAAGAVLRADSSLFKTTGQVRMLKVDNIFNVRDLGGWKGLGGYPVQYGKLFRGSRMTENSSATAMLTPGGKQAMIDAGIKADLDLRTDSEASISSSPIGSDIDYKRIKDSYSSRIATFAETNASIVAINWIISELKQNKPVYFHCSVGADRTGTVAFLIGGLLGLSEESLSKDFELTTFAKDYVTNEDITRQRTYVGRLDSKEASYKYAVMVDKVKEFPGDTFQEKIYWHLKTGVGGKNVSEADLKWLIDYMVNPIQMNASGTMNMEKGDTCQLVSEIITRSEANPDPKIVYVSSNPDVATVSENGLITAIGGGTAVISATLDGFDRSVTVKVPLVESYLPDTVRNQGNIYILKGSNLIANGSFEYGTHFLNWTAANQKPLIKSAFDIENYESGDSVYLRSKADGDVYSKNSIRTMWSIQKDKSYVFGYKVKNSQAGKQSVKNANLATSLITLSPVEIEGEGDDFTWDIPLLAPKRTGEQSTSIDSVNFEFPTYGDEWTDVRYVFTNTAGFQYIQVWFTHLSDGTNNTCLDNFYLCELTDITWVNPVFGDRKSDGRIFNLAGQEVKNPGRGVYIKDGKKYIVK